MDAERRVLYEQDVYVHSLDIAVVLRAPHGLVQDTVEIARELSLNAGERRILVVRNDVEFLRMEVAE
jgi:hypothetical protein